MQGPEHGSCLVNVDETNEWMPLPVSWLAGGYASGTWCLTASCHTHTPSPACTPASPPTSNPSLKLSHSKHPALPFRLPFQWQPQRMWPQIQVADLPLASVGPEFMLCLFWASFLFLFSPLPICVQAPWCTVLLMIDSFIQCSNNTASTRMPTSLHSVSISSHLPHPPKAQFCRNVTLDCYSLTLFLYIPHMEVVILYLSYSLWQTSFSHSFILSSSIHIVANGMISSFFLNHWVVFLCVFVL